MLEPQCLEVDLRYITPRQKKKKTQLELQRHSNRCEIHMIRNAPIPVSGIGTNTRVQYSLTSGDTTTAIPVVYVCI